MAYLFTEGSLMYLEVDSIPVTVMPLTMACWARVTDVSSAFIYMSIQDKDVSDQRFALFAAGLATGDPIRAQIRSGATANASTTTGFTANTWHHAAGVFTSSTSRDVFLNGGGKGSNTTNITPTGLDRISIGRFGDSTPGNYMDGDIAEPAIWNVALTDDEIAWLAEGYSPITLTHRLANLVWYRDLIRNLDRPSIGSDNLTAFNSPTVSAHTRMYYPAPPMIISIPVAAAAVASLSFLPYNKTSVLLRR